MFCKYGSFDRYTYVLFAKHLTILRVSLSPHVFYCCRDKTFGEIYQCCPKFSELDVFGVLIIKTILNVSI